LEEAIKWNNQIKHPAVSAIMKKHMLDKKPIKNL
jgi:hypothetical protein